MVPSDSQMVMCLNLQSNEIKNPAERQNLIKNMFYGKIKIQKTVRGHKDEHINNGRSESSDSDVAPQI